MKSAFPDIEKAREVVRARRAKLVDDAMNKLNAVNILLNSRETPQAKAVLRLVLHQHSGFTTGCLWMASEIFAALERDGFSNVPAGTPPSEALYLIEAIFIEMGEGGNPIDESMKTRH